jgi:1,4-dihydroxy-2-naphthoate octaprenyltransferase
MQSIERKFASTQPIPRGKDPAASAGEQEQRIANKAGERPKTALGEFSQLTRLPAAIAMTMPAVCGAALGWWQSGVLNWLALVYMFAGVLAMNVGFNLLGDYFDYRSSDEPELHVGPEPYFSGYSFLLHGMISPRAIRLIALVLLFLSFLCCLLLIWLVGWPMLFFAGLIYLLGFTYMVPPVKYAFRGWGLGELGILLSAGLLVIMGYYSQTETISWLPTWTAIPISLLTLSVVYNFNIVYYRRDWLNRKQTMIVHLGPARGLDLSSVLVVGGYVAFVLIVSWAHLPIWVLVCLAALPIALGSYGRLRRGYRVEDEYIDLYNATVNAVILTGILFAMALLFDRLF